MIENINKKLSLLEGEKKNCRKNVKFTGRRHGLN